MQVGNKYLITLQVITSDQYMAVNGKKFDIVKLVLAVLIVAIHSSMPGMWFRPILRLAVPLFFIISSYLFFSKQRLMTSLEERRRGLRKYAIRILKLYFFWFVLLLPLTIYFRKWYVDFSPETLLTVVRSFLFGSTFMASWFLMASLLGVVVVWLLSRCRVGDKWIVALGVVAYAACCMFSTYYSTVEWNEAVVNGYESYTTIFASPFNSFPCSILFVAIGKILAERKLSFSNVWLIIILVISMIVLYVEFVLTNSYCRVINDDCYFVLPVACACLFILIGQSQPCEIGIDTKKLRATSTIIYCSHATILSYMGLVLKNNGIERPNDAWLMLMFLTALAISVGLSLLLLKLEKYPSLSWLRYSH